MAKELKGRISSKASLLDKLDAREKEDELLKRHSDELEKKCQCMDELENKCERMEIEYEQLVRAVLGQPSTLTSSSDQ